MENVLFMVVVLILIFRFNNVLEDKGNWDLINVKVKKNI